MISILLSGLTLSVLHALIPNHWIPLVALAKKENWKLPYTLRITALSGGAHILSTILIGVVISFLSLSISQKMEAFTSWISPALLIGLGVFFLYQHYHHHHFQIDDSSPSKSIRAQIRIIIIAMFFSPCLEIEPLYILAGNKGWDAVLWLSVVYAVVSLVGIIAWVYLVSRGIEHLNKNWHGLAHNSGIIAGVILILVGLLSFFLDFH